MDEMDALERQVAGEVARLMGPTRPVDDLAILTAITGPSVTGRTRSMFSPAKAVIAGALVFGLVGVLLIAQPFGQPDGDLRKPRLTWPPDRPSSSPVRSAVTLPARTRPAHGPWCERVRRRSWTAISGSGAVMRCSRPRP